MIVDGIVILDGTTVGTFEIELDDRIIIRFDKSLSVKDTLMHASENGMPVGLMYMPQDEQEATPGLYRSRAAELT